MRFVYRISPAVVVRVGDRLTLADGLWEVSSIVAPALPMSTGAICIKRPGEVSDFAQCFHPDTVGAIWR